MTGTAIGKLYVDIGADLSGLKTGLKEAQKLNTETGKDFQSSWNSTADKLSSTGNKLSLALTAPLVAGFGAAISAASDLQETMSKVDVVFSDNADEVKTWASTSIESMGLAKETALAAAATFADMGQGMGMSVDAATDMSTSLVQLSADMASFSNTSQSMAQTALASVFTGETESLKQYGIVMTETNLQQFAMQQGINKTVAEMSEMEKVQLRYNFVLDRTSRAQGDFARTSDSTANQTRMAKEQVKELAATFGENLLPLASDVLGFVNDLLEGFNSLDPAGQKTILTIAGIAAAAGPVIKLAGTGMKLVSSLKSGISTLGKAFGGATSGIKGFGGSLSSTLGTIGLVITGVTLLVSALDAVLPDVSEGLQELQEETQKTKDAVSGLKDSYAEDLGEIEYQSKKTETLTSRLETLQSKTSLTKNEQEELRDVVAELNELYPDMGLAIDDVTGKLNMSTDDIRANTEAWKENAEARALYGAIEDTKDLIEQAGTNQDVAGAQVAGQFIANGQNIDADQGEALLQAYSNTIDSSGIFSNLLWFGTSALELFGSNMASAAKSYKENGDAAEEASTQLDLLSEKAEGLEESTDGATESIEENTIAIDSNGEAIQYATNAELETIAQKIAAREELTEKEIAQRDAVMEKQMQGMELTEAEQKVVEAASAVTIQLGNLMVTTSEEQAAALQKNYEAVVQAAQDGMAAINTAEQVGLDTFTKNQNANLDATRQWVDDMKILYGANLSPALLSYLEGLGTNGYKLVHDMVVDLEGEGDKVQEISDNFQESADLASEHVLNKLNAPEFSDAGEASVEKMAEGAESSTALTDSYTQIITKTQSDVYKQIKNSHFDNLGATMIKDMKRGMEREKNSLIDAAEGIAKSLKNALTINGTFTARTTTTTTGANTSYSTYFWHDKGGYFDTPQIIGIAEKRPEFVGAAEDLETFVDGAVKDAITSVSPSVFYGGTRQAQPKEITITNYFSPKEMTRSQMDYAVRVVNRRLGEMLS
nr:MAG TPA: minor tail protein [Caudoviricetes sp.]